MSQINLLDRYDQMNQVVEIYLKGESNEIKIAKQLGIKRGDVAKYLQEYRELAINDPYVRARAKEAMFNLDKHYDIILQELWNTVREAEFSNDYKAKASTLKIIADIENQRLSALQKAGLFDDREMADQMAEMERQRDVLVGIIKDVASHCDNCRSEVAKRLSKLDPNRAEPVDISESVVVGEAL